MPLERETFSMFIKPLVLRVLRKEVLGVIFLKPVVAQLFVQHRFDALSCITLLVYQLVVLIEELFFYWMRL